MPPLPRVLASLVLCCGCLAPQALAQPAQPTRLRVGTIVAAQQCTVYEGVKYRNSTRASGSSRGYVAASGSGYGNAYGGGGSSSFAAGGRSSYSASSQTSFETFFVKDCTSQFEGLRVALQAALAASGPLVLGEGGYVVGGRVEDVVPTGGVMAERSATRQVSTTAREGLRVTMSVTVTDRAGRIVFGAPVTTEIETGAAALVRDTVAADAATGEGLYSLLQRQLALAVARKVAFHFVPLAVVQGSGRRIRLNYGGPLIAYGALVSVMPPAGLAAARYRVTTVSEGSALADQVGDADAGAIGPGSRATIIEADDPAANQRILERVELP